MEKAGNDFADRIVAFDQIYSVTRKAGHVMNSCALRVGWPGFVANDDMLNEGTTFLRKGMGFARGHGSAAPWPEIPARSIQSRTIGHDRHFFLAIL